ncbi:class I SAM-dependent methyltransferase [Pseudomonas carnis]|uniref:methyltransferase domain-containing protein n=1 Tax=Pseudomonas carnis TaxID=2487355 RepID=UPI001D20C8B4|nr:class I SAM-dependent methyltransferase [Pseudomonas carnis]CAH0242074.1 hypothetical protein SRABI111_02940 [Pseudomonas carnis]CAH0287440.1 hypothetical protein SRABI08_04084 [Pseudomonas carnis]CAH0309934.1 hypothetical protein SRABI110_05018 [Pseudomonas carnis]CAH0316416.1 hypothetical protein SRABI64_05042 [Pseudomonas carnis]
MATFIVGYKHDDPPNASLLTMDFKVVNHSANFSLWKCFGDITREQFLELEVRGYNRIFESCFVVQPLQSAHRQEVIHLLFFEIAGDTYNATIDKSVNVGCYESLYEGARKLCAFPIKNVLDFGCGPGTVLASAVYRNLDNLLGFDFVQENRDYASAIGLEVLNEQQLDALQLECFDLVVCCYVLHYRSVSAEIIAKVFDRIRVGGIWAANFHKSQGVIWFSELLSVYPNAEIITSPSVFGDMMYVRKVGEE